MQPGRGACREKSVLAEVLGRERTDYGRQCIFVFDRKNFLISLSAFCLASLLRERHIYRRMHVICASGPDDGTDYPVEKKLRNAIARWSAYWIIALGGYLTISAVFQSLSMYLGYFIIAAVFFLLRLVINNPFQRFSGIRARRIPVRLLNAVSLVRV